MKVVKTCKEKSSNKTLSQIATGTIFTYGSGLHVFVKTGKDCAFCLETMDTFYLGAFGSGPLEDYKEFPNARVVLE